MRAIANDLNPVAALVLHATVDYPARYGLKVLQEFEDLGKRFLTKIEPHYRGLYPAEADDTQVLGYIYARTIRCLYCDGLIPLSPNWALASDGTGVRLRPQYGCGPFRLGESAISKLLVSHTTTQPER